ncbi:3-oxoacyl-ACP reductase family protein [Chelativorans sp. Marseille-P2723]|uniref:SDR family NAD(P)-dependent oxidoreductase n=1 Tax=Chelativorans sp. Marseille-P2723 TaxID=2709133 RepID=UPI001570A924|nr:3-oxoacyl-ACP reductase family protein [Chelativorans sp. Marseille-P2723]
MSIDLKTMFDLSGRVCVVTGGGRGIGKSIATALAAHGATVVITGRTQTTLDAAAEEISHAGGKVDAITADVSSEDDVERLARAVEKRHGVAKVLVNNAGVNAIYKRVEDTTLAEWNEIIATNLTGVFLTCRAFGRGMLTAGSGSIVTISSIGGRVGLGKTGPYCASKGGVELFTRSLAIDWAPKGVRVNTVAPAYVETDLTAGLSEHPVLSERITQRTPMRRFAHPDEIAGAVVYLASDASLYVTGQTIGVDGGWTAA